MTGIGIGSVDSDDYKTGENLLKNLASSTSGLFVYCANVQALIDNYRKLAAKKQVTG